MNWVNFRVNWLKLKTSGKLPIILEEFREHIPQINKEKLKDVNMDAIEIGNTRISTNYVQKSPRSLIKLVGA